MWNPFKRSTKTKSASTLTPEQKQYMNQMIGLGSQYLGSTYGTLAQMGSSPQSTYTPISDQYFQDVIANPYLNQREQQWSNLQGKASLGGKLHSGALARQEALFGADTARTLAEQRGGLFEKERQLQMSMDEAARQRQLQALSQLSGLLGTPLGVRAKENAMIQNPSAFDYLMMGVSGAKAVGSLLG